MDVITALIAYIIGLVVILAIVLWLNSAMRIQPETQSKKKKELFHSGDAIEPIPRKIYIDTYVFLAYFVIFDVTVFIVATAFFITGNNFVGTLLYVVIILITLLVALKKKFSRDVIDPIQMERGDI